MPENIEIKAVLKDRPRAEAAAFRLSGGPPEIIEQQDIFFRNDGARLKLRILAPDRGELIRYQRDDLAGPRSSRYLIARTSDPLILRDILSNSLEQIGTVAKTRSLYLVGHTRIHLDRIRGLGDFIELEVVLQPGQSENEGREVAEGLMSELHIERSDLIAGAYIDLLAAHSRFGQLTTAD